MPYKSLEITNAKAVYQQTPKTSQFYVGFSSVDISNTNSKLYDFDLIEQDIINQFQTRKGERVMLPNFGTIIWDLIMEPLTDETYELLAADINTICTSDPRVIPTQINLTEQPSGYFIELTLQLAGTNQSSNLLLTFNQETGLSVQQQ
jgi:phage baseplate assembly protein W